MLFASTTCRTFVVLQKDFRQSARSVFSQPPKVYQRLRAQLEQDVLEFEAKISSVSECPRVTSGSKGRKRNWSELASLNI